MRSPGFLSVRVKKTKNHIGAGKKKLIYPLIHLGLRPAGHSCASVAPECPFCGVSADNCVRAVNSEFKGISCDAVAWLFACTSHHFLKLYSYADNSIRVTLPNLQGFVQNWEPGSRVPCQQSGHQRLQSGLGSRV